MRGLRSVGTDDSPNSEQSTMTKMPSSSHWHGDGHSGATGPCPHTPGADPQTPPATQRSRSTGSMSDCPPGCIYTCRDVCLATLSFVLSGVSGDSFDQVRRFQCFFALPNTPLPAPVSIQKLLTAFFSCAGCPHCKSVPVTSSISSSLLSVCLSLSHHFIPRG